MAAMIAGTEICGRPMHGRRAPKSRPRAEQDAHDPAQQAEHDGLDQELPQDVDRAPTAIRKPISRVRSVTDTSMMFMMPTPPTTSEMKATIMSNMLIRSDVEVIVLVISVMSRMLKSSS